MYKSFVAEIDCDVLTWVYQIDEKSPVGRQRHEEDVSDYTEEEIIQLSREMFDLPEKQVVEIHYV